MIEPKAININSHGGVSIALHSPGTTRLTARQMVTLLVTLKSHLTQEELNNTFSNDEQHAIIRYYQKVTEKQQLLLAHYRQRESARALQKDFNDALIWYQYALESDLDNMLTMLWGWHKDNDIAPLPLVDQLMLSLVEQKPSLESLKASIKLLMADKTLGLPQQETIDRIEAVYGLIDWPSLDVKSRKRSNSPKHSHKKK
jgi:hypothetical protein